MKAMLARFFAICILLAAVATAQEPRGSIVGQVSDANGGLIPGAAVTILNVETGQTLKLTTSDSGSYSAPLLPIGRYRIEAELAGFKRFQRDNVEMRVGDRLQIDIRLEIGQMTDSITVTEGAPMLQAADASLGQLVDSRRVDELPIAHGNPYHLIALSPGTSFEGDPKLNRPYDPTHIVAYAMGGTKQNTSDITLDGVANTALAGQGTSNNSVTASYVPPSDAIAEFKVQTATFDAKIGQTSGGLVNISLKQGSNAPHGTAYLNYRAPSLMANDFFANRAGQALADFKYKRIGTSLNGPVYIPKIYNGRNRTFFMFAYEHIMDINPRGQSNTVPTDAERTGDFSELLKVGSNYQIYNPFSRRGPVSGRYTADPFPGNVIPQSLINPVAQAVLGFVPSPLNAGTTADHMNNYPTPNAPENNHYYTIVTRVDHNLGANNRFFVRANLNNRNAASKDWYGTQATGQQQDYGARGASFDDVHTFSPTLILNIRYGYGRYVRLTQPLRGRGYDLTKLGFPAALNSAIDPALREFPYFNVANSFVTNNIGEDRNMDTHSLVAAFTKVRGSHNIEFGTEFRAYRQDRYNLSTQTSGYFDFDSTYTKGPNDNSSAAPSGQGLASFLLGIPDSKSLITRNTSMAEQSTAWMFYLQDNWRLSRKLSLTLGARYELEGPVTERYNRTVTGLDTTTTWPQAAAVQAAFAPNAFAELPVSALQVRGGLQFAGVNGQPRTAWNRDTNNLAPRVGLAWTVDDKTVIRTGFGMFFSPMGLRRTDVLQSGFSRTTAFLPTADNLNFTSLSNPFSGGILEPTGSSLGMQTEAGNSITFFNQNIQAPYMERWQFSVQRQLPGQLLLEVAYVGNRGVRLETETATPSTTNQVSLSYYRNLNAIPDQTLSTSAVRDTANVTSNNYWTASIPNPFYGIAGFGTLSNQTTIARNKLMVAYPQFGSNVYTTVNQGASWYHALDVRLEKRYSTGLTVNVAYTWSKYMEALDYLNAGDPAPSRALSQQDHTHRAVASWIYELPFGKGRAIFGAANRAVDAIVGGWQVQGVYVYQGGAPLTWLDTTFFGADTNAIALGTRNVDQWFNTGAGFLTNSSLKPQNHLRSWPLRLSSVRSDGINNFDLSGVKKWTLSEKLTLRFSGEFLNAMNHARFKAPVTDPYDKAFGQVSDTNGNPRAIQLGLKLTF